MAIDYKSRPLPKSLAVMKRQLADDAATLRRVRDEMMEISAHWNGVAQNAAMDSLQEAIETAGVASHKAHDCVDAAAALMKFIATVLDGNGMTAADAAAKTADRLIDHIGTIITAARAARDARPVGVFVID